MKPTTSHIKIHKECVYCGETGTNGFIRQDDKDYCCFGCATLDKISRDGFIQDEEVPVHYKQYDLPEIFALVIEAQTEEAYKVRLHTPAIHCSSCVNLLESLPEIDERVRICRVNFEDRACEISASKALQLSELAFVLDRLGYPPQFNLKGKAEEEQKKADRMLLKRLAVTGFCFGNSMLFSMPHYLGLQLAGDAFFASVFKTLNLGLSLVVLIYGAQPYFSSAIKSIMVRRAHINIPIALGAAAIWGWSVYEVVSGSGFGYFDSLAGLIFFLLAGKWFQSRVYRKVSFERSLHDLLPMTVRKVTSGEQQWVRVDELSVGDTVRILNNEVIPVSGVLTHGHAFIDYSFVTGESVPQHINHGKEIFIGGRQQSGTIDIEIMERPDLETIWSAWKTPKKTTADAHWTHQVSKYFTPVVLAIAFLSAFFWMLYDPGKTLFVFSSVLIVACPCALALSAPFTFGSMMRVFSKNGFFLKSSDAASDLQSIDHIVFDKTGTLTEPGAAEVISLQDELSEDEVAAVSTLTSMSTHIVGEWLTAHLATQSSFEVTGFKEEAGKGISGVVNGSRIRVGSSSWLQPNDLIAGTHSCVEIDGKVKAIFSFKNVYRTKLQGILNNLGKSYDLSISSGDNSGEMNRLSKLFSGFVNLAFDSKPEDKKRLMKSLQERNQRVLMIGDGLNDQSALSSSDLGIAVTENMNGFYPNADGVLMSESFEKLPGLMELSRYSKKVLWYSLTFSILYNLIGISFAVTGQLNPLIAAILMPLSSITVVGLVTALVSLKSKKIGLL